MEISKKYIDIISDRMVKRWDKDCIHIINPTKRIMKLLSIVNLDQMKPRCKGKRFVIQKQNNKEPEIVCLLRHIRNSLAHGRVFIKIVGNTRYILFEDVKKCGGISARIICTEKELDRWEKIIKRYNNN